MSMLYAIKCRVAGTFFSRVGGSGGDFYGSLKHARLYQTPDGAQDTISEVKQVHLRNHQPYVVRINLTEETDLDLALGCSPGDNT